MDATIGNITNSSALYLEAALPPEIALTLRSVLQAILTATFLAGLTSIIYLHHTGRLRKRLYGPLASGPSNQMMFLADIGLLITSVCQFCVITFHDVPCVLHSTLSTGLIPIAGTVFLLRAWVLVVQFARVHEQLRWVRHYQTPAKKRAESEDQHVSLSIRFDMWITTHPIVLDPRLLIPACILFSVVIWVPSVVIEVHNQCDHELPNLWNDFNVFIFLGLALLLATKLRGKIDTIGVRKELQLVAVIFVVMQIGQMFVDTAETSINWNSDQDPDEVEDQYGVELAFSMWYIHGIQSIQLLLLVVLVAVRPALGIFIRKNRDTSRRTVQQKLQLIFNDRQLKEEFRDFLAREFSMENLTFYDMISSVLAESRQNLRLSNEESMSDLQRTLINIYQDFIVESARFQVNLPNDERKEIEKCINNLRWANETSSHERIALLKACIGVYSQAQTSIFNLMATDSLPRFLHERNEDMTTTQRSYNTVKSGQSTHINVSVQALKPTSQSQNSRV